MRRRRKIDTAGDRDRWIVSYADLITMLFAFFVVMYAVSSVNVAKMKHFISSMQGAFTPASTAKSPVPLAINQDLGGVPLALKPDEVRVRQNEAWTEIEIKANALFTSGSAIPNQQGIALLKDYAKKLQGTKHYIVVEGYTDDHPINTAQFPSNWELSAARAATVVRLLTEYGVDAKRITAVGYGQHHPTSDNDSDAGRAANRRVVIVVARDQNVQRLLNPGKALIPKQVVQEPIDSPKAVSKDIQREENVIKVPVVKAIRTEKGGLKFTRGATHIKKGTIAPDILDEKGQNNGN